MNENIDLTKILKNCPKETKLYSILHGEVKYVGINDKSLYKVEFKSEDGEIFGVTLDGRHLSYFNGECILLPSKDQRDWSKFTAPWYKKEEPIKPKFKVGDKIRHKETNKDDVYEISKVYDDSYGIVGFNWMIYMKYQDQYELVPNKFDPKTLKPFDKVLVRDTADFSWACDLFSYILDGDVEYKYKGVGCLNKYCIPYNDDTKHLVGTKEEAPDFYRYWEE